MARSAAFDSLRRTGRDRSRRCGAYSLGMTQPPPRPRRPISLADVDRFLQDGGLERAAINFKRAAAKGVTELWASAEAGLKRSGELVVAVDARARRWGASAGPERLRAGIDAFGTQLRATRDFSRTNKKWSYLAEQMGGVEGLTLMFALAGRELNERSPSLNATQRRLASISGGAVVPAISMYLADSQVLAEVKDHVQRADLWEGSRRQLLQGLAHVGADDHDLACPQLFSGLEGAFWKVGRDCGLVAPAPTGAGTMVFTRGKRNGEVAAGLGQLVDGMRGEQLVDAGLAAFIKELVYGGPGQPFRHGNAEDGWQERALLLVGALAGWLARFGAETDPDLLRKAIDRCKERLRAEAEAERAKRETRRPSSAHTAA